MSLCCLDGSQTCLQVATVFLVQNSPSWIYKYNSSQNRISLWVLGLAGGLLSCEFPHCWWGCLKLPSQSARLVTSFRAWNSIPMQSLLGEATKNALKIVRKVGSCFLEDFYHHAHQRSNHFSHSWVFMFFCFCFQYFPNNIEVFQIYIYAEIIHR